MPPKRDVKKTAERTSDTALLREEREDPVASEATVGQESEASTLSLSSLTLERILAANNQSFIAAREALS